MFGLIYYLRDHFRGFKKNYNSQQRYQLSMVNLVNLMNYQGKISNIKKYHFYVNVYSITIRKSYCNKLHIL